MTQDDTSLNIRNILIPRSSTIQLVKENPKRSGTKANERFSLYRSGMTVGEFLQKGGKIADLRNDTNRHFIKIVTPQS